MAGIFQNTVHTLHYAAAFTVTQHRNVHPFISRKHVLHLLWLILKPSKLFEWPDSIPLVSSWSNRRNEKCRSSVLNSVGTGIGFFPFKVPNSAL